MSGGSPNNGVVDTYDDMTLIPVISHSPTNNALVSNNPAQTTENMIVDVSITNTHVQTQLDSKAPLHNLTFSGTVGGLSKAI